MGLDSLWVREAAGEFNADESVAFDPPLRLTGGMFSGHGQGSFRGKVYNDLVERVTGVSLYQDLIPNEVIKSMATKLRAYRTHFVMGGPQTEADLRARQAGLEWDISVRELDDLVRMFETYAAAGCSLHGWW